MFDQPPKPNTNKDFPDRTWVGISCANPACPNYGKTDVRCPKAGKNQKTNRQRYKCKRCKKTFYPLDPPKGRLRINRAQANERVETKPEENLEGNQEKEKQAQRKQVSFFLTYKAAQGLYEVCDFLGVESSELLEQIGQGTLEVRFARKEIKLSSEAIASLKNIKPIDS